MNPKDFRPIAEAMLKDKAVGDIMVALCRSAIFEEVYAELRSRHRELGEEWDEIAWPYKSHLEEARSDSVWQRYRELGRLLSSIGEKL